MELRESEFITAIDGNSVDGNGWTISLLAETSQGKTWGPHGDHKTGSNIIYSISLRPSPRGNIKLAFISGNETRQNVTSTLFLR